MTEQLVLFRRPDGPTEHYTTTGIAAAGWRDGGQFYWDLRRWLEGAEVTIVEEVPKRPRLDDLKLTETQVAYFTEGGR